MERTIKKEFNTWAYGIELRLFVQRIKEMSFSEIENEIHDIFGDDERFKNMSMYYKSDLKDVIKKYRDE